MPITLKQLQQVEWKLVYQYKGISLSFETFACPVHRLSLTHERVGKGKTKIIYTAYGRKTDSPSQAVRIWNEEERRVAAEMRGVEPKDLEVVNGRLERQAVMGKSGNGSQKDQRPQRGRPQAARSPKPAARR